MRPPTDPLTCYDVGQLSCARTLLERRGYRACFNRDTIAQCPDCQTLVQATKVTDVLLCPNAGCKLKHELREKMDGEFPEVALKELAERLGLVIRTTVAVFGRTIILPEPLDGRR